MRVVKDEDMGRVLGVDRNGGRDVEDDGGVGGGEGGEVGGVWRGVKIWGRIVSRVGMRGWDRGVNGVVV